MKNTLLYTALFLAQFGFAQSAGNAIENSSTGNSMYGAMPSAGNMNYGEFNGLISYQQPKGVNLSPVQSGSGLTPIKADVMINMKATSYVAILSLTQVGETVQETDSLMDIRLNQVFDELKRVGISLDETHVDFISMVPRYDFETTEKRYSKTYNEVPVGFEMKKNIHVRFANHDRVNDLISAAAKAEIYDLVKIDYNVGNMDMVYEQLRARAEEIVQKKVESYTRMGFTLEAMQYGSTQGSVYPMERYMRYTAAHTSVPQVKPAKNAKDGKDPKPVTVNYTEKPTTIYYEKVPYNQFDVVLNADMTEPTVQFYMNLTVNYKIVLAEVAKREREDRDLDLQLRRAEIQQKIRNVSGGHSSNNTSVTVRTGK